jgi:hypothetical protein
MLWNIVLQWYIEPPTHGISNPLTRVYWTLYPWYIELPTHGILNRGVTIHRCTNASQYFLLRSTNRYVPLEWFRSDTEFYFNKRGKKRVLHKWGIKLNKHGVKNKTFVSAGSHNSPVWKFFGFNETQSDWDMSINKSMTDCRICDAKMKYNGKAYIAKHHVDINIEKTLIVFSHVEQPT